MNPFPLLLALLLLCVSGTFAQENQDIKKCVAFIFLKQSDGKYHARGTGFFASFPRETDTTKTFTWFVTAKHVVQKKDKSFYPEIYVRLNTSLGGSEFVEFPLFSPRGRHIAVHPDSTVDIVAISLPSGLDKYEILAVQSIDMSTKQTISQYNLREGDDVVFCGMFLNYFGKKKNYPIYRFGKVALLTDERVPFEGEQVYLYLFETTAFGGNSGSPVFFRIGPNRDSRGLVIGASTTYSLAGIVRGFYGAQIDTAYVKTAVGDTILFQNAGIAAITPSYQLLEVFNEVKTELRTRK